jgi:hypothetical protein
MSFSWRRCAFSSLFGLAALGAMSCSANIKTALGPNGSHIITCGNGMTACVAKADKICGEDGYTILEGVNRTKLLGGESSSYRERSDIGQLTVKCGLPDEDDELTPVVYKLPERTDEPIVVDEPIAPAVGVVCAPGVTLACVGAGACQGGQVCLASGRGYGPCDCGENNPRKPASERANGAAPPTGPSTVEEKTGDSSANESLPVVPGALPTPTPLGHQK